MLSELRTRRLVLRPVAAEDLALIADRIGDFEVAKMLSVVPHPYVLADAKDWFAQTSAVQENGERAFAILLKEQEHGSDGPIGVVSIGRPDGTPNFGYWLARPFWGRGFMTEAGRAAFDWLFASTQTESVSSGALVENPASLNVLRKLGFGNETPCPIPVRARAQELPGTRVSLSRESYLAAGEAVA